MRSRGIALERNPSDPDNERITWQPDSPNSRKLSLVDPDVLSTPPIRVNWRIFRAEPPGKVTSVLGSASGRPWRIPNAKRPSARSARLLAL